MIGQTISQYVILEKLGEGGMGVVYKARDTKLDREVALKFLPPHLAASEQDRARFVHEAKAAAALNHPNVCSIIDIQEHPSPGGVSQLFIVMEYVEGHTLREKMDGITQAKAVDVGIQVADGLSAAHEKGIVHRDVKPENIMIRKDGLVQIMDFGLAKLRATGSRITQLTKEGSTVGTAGYMSPEQVQGETADHRSDIFSLGVLLYELLTGERPFKGVHETALMYEIVNVDPAPPSAVTTGIDPELDRIVLECLQKEPDERYNSVKDIAKDLKRFKRESTRSHASRITASRPVQHSSRAGVPTAASAAGEASPVRSRRELLAWLVAGASVAAVIYLALRSPEPASPRVLARSSIVTPESLYIHSFGAQFGPPVISPEGRTIAFTGVTADGVQRIYVRSLDEDVVRPLPGTEEGFQPFWSPDGKYLGYFDGSRMRKIDLAGGSPITITEVPNPRGGSWSENGTIVYARDYQSSLLKVSDDGKGTPVQATALDSTRGEGSHRWAHFLPDGEHFLYLARAASESGDAEGDAIFVGSLDGSTRRMLVQSSYNPSYSDGYLFFSRPSTLLAQRFDPGTLSLQGDPIVVQKGVLTDLSYNYAVYSVSKTGALLCQTGEAEAGARPLFMDRTGAVVRVIEDKNEHDQARFSPDGSKVAAYLFDMRSRRSNIWVFDLRSGGKRKLTTRPEGDFFPVWSPDGSTMYFSSGRLEETDIFTASLSRSGSEEYFGNFAENEIPLDCSPDGRTLLVNVASSTTGGGDLLLVPTSGGEGKQVMFQQTKFDEAEGRISPDGIWVAFTSDESGQQEIYIKRFSAPKSDPLRVSTGGGTLPTWGPDSREIVYVNPRREFISLKLKTTGEGLEPGAATRLFTAPPFASLYDMSPDGKTFVVSRTLEFTKFPPLTLIQNWDLLVQQNASR